MKDTKHLTFCFDFRFGEEFVRTGSLDLWGGQPGDLCTNPQVSLSASTAVTLTPTPLYCL